MEIYDKIVTVPRMISWYEDRDNPGADLTKPGWASELLSIWERLEKETHPNRCIWIIFTIVIIFPT